MRCQEAGSQDNGAVTMLKVEPQHPTKMRMRPPLIHTRVGRRTRSVHGVSKQKATLGGPAMKHRTAPCSNGLILQCSGWPLSWRGSITLQTGAHVCGTGS